MASILSRPQCVNQFGLWLGTSGEPGLRKYVTSAVCHFSEVTWVLSRYLRSLATQLFVQELVQAIDQEPLGQQCRKCFHLVYSPWGCCSSLNMNCKRPSAILAFILDTYISHLPVCVAWGSLELILWVGVYKQSKSSGRDCFPNLWRCLVQESKHWYISINSIVFAGM